MSAERPYRCHQCFGPIEFDEIAHLDLYVDLCWIQCEICAAAFGPTCGVDRKANPHPHGYWTCPLREALPLKGATGPQIAGDAEQLLERQPGTTRASRPRARRSWRVEHTGPEVV